MACSRDCKIGLSAADEQERIEDLGRQALEGALSWRAAATAAGVYPKSLKNHMLNHVVAPAVAEAEAAIEDEYQALIDEAKAGLQEQFFLAPPDVKPLILAAMHNLDHLREMRPSQEHLIKALKTVQEMTGMKNEQHMLLAFGQAMFGQKPKVLKVENTATPALEASAEEAD